MNDYHKQAQALRQQVAELDELVHHPIYENEEGDEQKADRLWQEHVELLKRLYPKPDPRDHIQVTLRDIYRDDAVVGGINHIGYRHAETGAKPDAFSQTAR